MFTLIISDVAEGNFSQRFLWGFPISYTLLKSVNIFRLVWRIYLVMFILKAYPSSRGGHPTIDYIQCYKSFFFFFDGCNLHNHFVLHKYNEESYQHQMSLCWSWTSTEELTVKCWVINWNMTRGQLYLITYG